MKCLWCGEAVESIDNRVLPGLQPMHLECSVRCLVGSVAHQKRECSCFGGTGEDAPNLSSRQAALAVYQYASAANFAASVNREGSDRP